jgi:DNA-binding NarL/FixJ family response regulator
MTQRRRKSKKMAVRKARAREGPNSSEPIRVFFVDDQSFFIGNLETYINDHPNCGVRLVGQARRNEEKLPDLLKASQAQVALVDLSLGGEGRPSAGPVHQNGLDACRRLKQELPDLKVVAYTQYPRWRKDAKDHGADEFLLKMTDRELVEALKDVVLNRDRPSAVLPDNVVGLELTQRDRSVSIEVSGIPDLIEFKPIRVAFALLWYLAEERRERADGWLTMVQKSLSDHQVETKWSITNKPKWLEACEAAGGTEWESEESIPVSNVDSWRNHINENVKGKLETPLLVVSGKGPFQPGERRVSSLRRSIRAESITFRRRVESQNPSRKG